MLAKNWLLVASSPTSRMDQNNRFGNAETPHVCEPAERHPLTRYSRRSNQGLLSGYAVFKSASSVTLPSFLHWHSDDGRDFAGERAIAQTADRKPASVIER